MNDRRESQPDVAALLAAALAGAVAMYLLDPDKGRRRRAIARDKAASAGLHASRFAGKAARDIAHRFDGVRARARHAVRRDDTPDDLRLIERVRSRMGRVVSHPHAIQIGAWHGRVTLSGPILAAEARALLDAARAVPGVRAVDDHLVAHETAASISSLQGTPRRPPAARRVAPSARVVAFVGGLALAALGAALGAGRARD